MKTTMTRWGLLALGLGLLGGCGDDEKAQSAQVEPEDDAGNNANNNSADVPEQDAANNTNNSAADVPDAEPDAEVGAPDGSACAADADCAGGACLLDGYPGGLCTTLGCASDGRCQGAAQCAFLDAERTESACFGSCEEDTDCREGWGCQTFGNTSFCLPRAPEPLPDGSPCADREECAGGICLTEADGFPGGQCTTVGCTTRADCSGPEGNAACLVASQPSFCVQLCDAERPCREGYLCQPVQGGVSYCTPSPTAGTVVPEEGELPFDLVCDPTLVELDAFEEGLSLHRTSFTLPEGTTSYMVVPYSPGGQIYPVSLAGPGGELDMFGEYGFALANASFMINLSPILVPQAPQFASVVASGEHTLDMAAGQDLCRYVLPKSGPGQDLDLNLYFVGAGGLTAASAPGDEGFQDALARFREIYRSAGVELRNLRYNDITGEDAARYRIIRNQEAVFRLVAAAPPPGEAPDDILSVNVFFIDDFAIDGGSVLGISAGLPGAAGFHGGRGSGLVFSAAVAEDSELLGQVLAHEVGHYLGLFHTTEQGAQGQDPLGDTPFCPSNQWRNPGNCPDIQNLMFPFAGNDHANVTDDQAFVLHANPLVK
jgi:hypothetical protein